MYNICPKLFRVGAAVPIGNKYDHQDLESDKGLMTATTIAVVHCLVYLARFLPTLCNQPLKL